MPYMPPGVTPNDEMVAALHTLRRMGYELHIVTSRPDGSRDQVTEWLRGVAVLIGDGEVIQGIHFTNGGRPKITLEEANEKEMSQLKADFKHGFTTKADSKVKVSQRVFRSRSMATLFEPSGAMC